jgi:NAD(P)-dependent dehydrogenase (short-subunit alcohol dehydrogenase family)
MIVVAGCKGLIGKAIHNHLGCHGIDIETDVIQYAKDTDISVFINATYPKTMASHIRLFFNTTEILCQKKRKISIINMASIYGVIASKPYLYEDTLMSMPSWYGFVKAGIIHHAKLMTTEYYKYGVRVNCISPCGVHDPVNPVNPNFLSKVSKISPSGKLIEAKDILPAIDFLLRDTTISGQNIIIDGGFTL